MKKYIIAYVTIIIILPTLACSKNRKKKSGKVTAPVVLDWSAPKTSQKGDTVTINFSGYPQTDATDFKLAVDLPKGVTLVSGKTQVDNGATKARQKIKGSVQVRADADGRYTLPFTGHITFQGQRQARTIPIYFQVGKQQESDASIGTLSKDKKYKEIKAQ